MPLSGSYFYPVMNKPTSSLGGGNLTVNGDGTIAGTLSVVALSGAIALSGTLNITDLPTSNPHITGSLWNDTGTVKVSGY